MQSCPKAALDGATHSLHFIGPTEFYWQTKSAILGGFHCRYAAQYATDPIGEGVENGTLEQCALVAKITSQDSLKTFYFFLSNHFKSM